MLYKLMSKLRKQGGISSYQVDSGNFLYGYIKGLERDGLPVVNYTNDRQMEILIDNFQDTHSGDVVQDLDGYRLFDFALSDLKGGHAAERQMKSVCDAFLRKHENLVSAVCGANNITDHEAGTIFYNELHGAGSGTPTGSGTFEMGEFKRAIFDDASGSVDYAVDLQNGRILQS